MNQRFIALLHFGEYQTDESGAIMGVLEGGYGIEYFLPSQLRATAEKDIFIVENRK